MSKLCEHCGFTVDPACGGCGSDPQYWDKGPARDAALDAVAQAKAERDGDGNAASERHIPAAFPLPEAPMTDDGRRDSLHLAYDSVRRALATEPLKQGPLPAPELAAPDMVNHPPHYASGAVECIDAIHAALGDDGLVAYCRGAAMKYLWRMDKKGNAVQDLEKAGWYVQKAVEVARGARP